jgi:hypothetical protein
MSRTTLTIGAFVVAVVTVGVAYFLWDSESSTCVQETPGLRRQDPRFTLRKEGALRVPAPGITEETYRVRGGEIRSDPARAVSAEVVEQPKRQGRLADVLVRANAKVIRGGTRVKLKVCAPQGGLFSAGRYRGGEISIYGSRVRESTSPLVVTQRFGFPVAIAVLAITGFAYLFFIWPTRFPPGDNTAQTAVFAIAALAAWAGAYWGVYLDNDTWGADVPKNVGALIAAAVAAAVAATLAAQLAAKAPKE